MMAFLNERSLEEHANWGKALKFFLRATDELKTAGALLFRDSAFFFGGSFKQRFNSVSIGLPPMERALVRQIVFSNAVWKCWRAERVSAESAEYQCDDPPFSARDESVCEAAEWKFRSSESEPGMLSADDSNFADKSTFRVRNAIAAEVELPNSVTVEAVRTWIARQRGYFDPALNLAPRDSQTILEKDPVRFHRTGRVQYVGGKYRRVYEEANTRRQFYVDEGHPGHSAHLEVFDADGSHLGEADITTGTLDPSKREPGRAITL